MRIVFLLLCLIVFLDFCVGLILCQSSLFHNTCFSQENQLKHIIFPPYRQTMYLHTHRYVLQLFWISLNYFQLSSWFVGIASDISCYCFSWNYSKSSLPVPHTQQTQNNAPVVPLAHWLTNWNLEDNIVLWEQLVHLS